MSYKNSLDTSSKKFNCPKCGKKSFVLYIETETKNYLDETFGRCDRQDNCGYHNAPPNNDKTAYLIEYLDLVNISDKAFRLVDKNGLIHFVPKVAVLEANTENCFIAEWFLSKAETKINYLTSEIKTFDVDNVGVVYVPPTPPPKKEPSYHNLELVDKMYCNGNGNKDNFTLFLKSKFSTDEVLKATQDYKLTDWNTSTVFWQIDTNEKVRAGKVMMYDPITGKRSKTINTNWVHSKMKLPDFNLNQCLFGLHLINENTQKKIALVEAEKTAVIMSIQLPDFIWLATGSESGFKLEYLEPIKHRKIIAFPDKGKAFESWSNKAIELKKQGFDISMNNVLENNENCPDSGDLADLDWEQPPPPKEYEFTPESKEIHRIVQERKRKLNNCES